MTQVQKATKELAILQKDITDEVIGKITELKGEGLVLPPNYSAANALKSAFFVLQGVEDKNHQPALQVCSRPSIANALLNMVIQGLSPAKTQCYFIVYGTELQMSRSYFGTQAVIKRLTNVKDIYANVIYEGDELDYENRGGKDYLLKHKTKLENRDNPIIGAYAIVEKEDGDKPMTIMTKKEIDASWSQSKTSQSVHKKFPQEMAKRTVINRAAKAYINTSDDSDILVQSINETTANEYEDERIDRRGAMDVEAEIRENANQENFPEEPMPAPKQEPRPQRREQTMRQTPPKPEREPEPAGEELWQL
mgnify:CR=1 FL=1